MSERGMTILEELREQDRKLDRDVERIMSASPRCPIHGNHFVLGVGIGNEFFSFGSDGGCPTCFREKYNAEKSFARMEEDFHDSRAGTR